jgi:hypothetical protein
MATYTELRSLFSYDVLLNKVEVAIVIAANDLAGGTPTTAEKAWIEAVFSSPRVEAKKALMAVLAENSGATVATIQGASDANIQTNVNGIVSILVDAKAGV